MKSKKVLAYLTTAIFTLSLAISTSNNMGAKAATTVKASVATTTQKNVVTYFPNWAMYNAVHQSMVPKDIPWDKITVVNHSFFTVDASYKIASLDEFADYQKQLDHSGDWTQTLKGCFGEYQYYKGIYPNVKILVSVGGWTRGENFHAMALTAASRKVFTDSVVAFLKLYPFIDGIDIDWEYPGIDRKADPNDQYDKGCPGGPEDKANYTLLMQDIRNAYNTNGLSGKMLSVAAAAGYDKMALVEPDKYIQYLDFMNVMTYDIHGAWENTTNHQSPLYANPADPSGTSPVDLKNKYNTDYAMKAYTGIYKIPVSKLNVGSPFYSRGWKGVTPGPNGDGLYQPASGAYTGTLDNPQSPGGQESWVVLKQLETTPGWKKYYDNVANAVYLYNASTGVFLSYEDEKTLTDRCNYVLNNGYGGMLIWDSSDDDLAKGSPMTTIISDKMKGSAVIKLQAAVFSASAVSNGTYTLTGTVPANNTAKAYKILEGTSTTSIASGSLIAGQATSQAVSLNVIGKAAGTYVYTLVVSDAMSSLSSNQVSVTVSAAPLGNVPAKPSISKDNWDNAPNYNIIMNMWWGVNGTSWKLYENGIVVSTKTLTANSSNAQTSSVAFTGKAKGTYVYQAELINAAGSTLSDKLTYTVN